MKDVLKYVGEIHKLYNEIERKTSFEKDYGNRLVKVMLYENKVLVCVEIYREKWGEEDIVIRMEFKQEYLDDGLDILFKIVPECKRHVEKWLEDVCSLIKTLAEKVEKLKMSRRDIYGKEEKR